MLTLYRARGGGGGGSSAAQDQIKEAYIPTYELASFPGSPNLGTRLPMSTYPTLT